jgi:hypothetical protein
VTPGGRAGEHRRVMQQPQRRRDTLAALNAMAFLVLAVLLLIYAQSARGF